MTITSLNNYSFAFNGFVFGGSGSPYQIQSVAGLESLPNLRVQDSDRGYLDGMFSGRDFLSGRLITITMQVLSGNNLTAQGNFKLLQAALVPQQTGTSPLQFQLSTSDNLQVINARVRSSSVVIDPEYTYGFIKAQYTFFCPNPVYFDNTVQLGTMLPTTIFGRTYNRTYNMTYGGGSLTGSLNVPNSGWTTIYPKITINGPIVNPSVGSFTANASLNFNYTMAQSDVIVVDLYNRTVLLNGTPARNLLLGSSQWFGATSGLNTFYFTSTVSASVVVGQTQALVQWSNGYI